jgi:hypothetical protein
MQKPASVFSDRRPDASRLDPWVRAAITVWIVILVSILIRLVVLPTHAGVYPIFANAARNWLAGQGVYNGAGEPYRYSPFITICFIPFSLLPDFVGGIVWRALNAAVFLGALAWWCRSVLPVSLTARQVAWFFLLIVPMSVGSLNNGQSNALILGLLLAAGAAVAGKRWNLATVCLAIACLFKIYPIAIALLLAAGYPRRLGIRLILALTVGLGLPFLLGDRAYVFEQHGDWIHHLRVEDRYAGPIETTYRDIRMLFRVWLVPLSARTFLVAQLAAAAGIAAVCLAKRPRLGQPNEFLTRALVLGCCWMTVFGPATEPSTYILIGPALAWAVMQAWLTPGGNVRRAVVLLIYGLTGLAQAVLWFPWGPRFNNYVATHSVAGTLLFTWLMGTYLWQMGKSGEVGGHGGPARLEPAGWSS